MKASAITPLEPWIRRCIGLSDRQPLTLEALANYKLSLLRQTIGFVRRHSPFYRAALRHLPQEAIGSLEQIETLPFTTAQNLLQDPLALVCVSHDDIARVVSLPTSGTTGPSKRLFFSDEDLERTVDFFHNGLPLLIQPGQQVMICMPGESPGSIGALLLEAIKRLPAKGFVHGLVQDPMAAARELVQKRVDCVIGIPVQVLALTGHTAAAGLPAGAIRSVLLSTDHVCAALEQRLRQVWGCAVYHHYGMTEMGYGGGVDCCAHDGYHLREADLHVEIIEPDSGRVLPPGGVGEVVFTTLTRRAMPLLRYRTGDLSRFIPGPCPCGSCLPRLEKIHCRIGGGRRLKSGAVVEMAVLDEAIFAVPDVIDYWPSLSNHQNCDHLRIEVSTGAITSTEKTVAEVRARLQNIEPLCGAIACGQMCVDVVVLTDTRPPGDRFAKRRIIDSRRNLIPESICS